MKEGIGLYRDVIEKLICWKEKADRQPALLTGAKGVGKTTAVREFAGQKYKKLIVFDLKNNGDEFVFKGELTRKRFDQAAAAYAGEKEKKEEILVVFDHLDEEKVGDHSARDLMQFIIYNLMDYNICVIASLNVVRTFPAEMMEKADLFFMYPVSLKEFFLINDDSEMLEAVENCAEEEFPKKLLEKLSLYLKVYFITGGMPKVIQAYMDTRELEMVNKARKETYESYLSYIDAIPDEKFRKRVREVYLSVGKQLDRPDKRFKYSQLGLLAGKKRYSAAVEWLVDRGIAVKVKMLEAGSSHHASEYDGDFKLYLNDIGILTFSGGICFEDLVMGCNPYETQNYALLEQLVLQQLQVSELREIAGFFMGDGKEEVEFVCRGQGENVPVKIAFKDSLGEGMKEYQNRYHPEMMIYITENTMKMERQEMSVPVFAVWNL